MGGRDSVSNGRGCAYLGASPPESLRAFRNTDFGRRKVRFFGPATMVARNLPVILALVATWHRPGHRAWMLLATGCFAFITIFTLVHIYPINAVLFGQSGGDGSADEIRAMAAHWVLADRFRFVIGLAGLFAVLQAFRLPMQPYAE